MDNIESLLQDLDAHLAEEGSQENDFLSVGQNPENAIDNKVVTQNKPETSSSSEVSRKQFSTKYSDFGYDIHKKLKESRQERSDYSGPKNSWTTKATQEKTNKLSVPSTIVTGKSDVYAEPVFGLRLINPVVSSQFIQSKMSGKQPVAVANISYHLKCGDKNCDWVFAGALVFKSGLKTSQKGSQYCVWKISDLKSDLQQITVYLFSKACSDLWKVSIGTVVAILNATPFHKEETASKDDLTLTVRNADQVMIWGGSRDYGICKAKKKNGENCTSFVNKSHCEFCIYHVKNEYNKFSNKRSDLQGSFSNGNIGLRNKILGKSEVFYGGKSYTALKIPSRSSKIEKRDNKLLNMLPLNPPKKSCSSTESDNLRLELLSSKPKPSASENNDSNPDDPEPQKLNKVHIVTQSIGRQNSLTGTDTPVKSRLHLLKEAGTRMIQTGQTTRVTLVNPDKKNPHVSFATIFSSDPTKEEHSVTGLKHVESLETGTKRNLSTKSRKKNTPESSTVTPSTGSSSSVSSASSNKNLTSVSRCAEILLEIEPPSDTEKLQSFLSPRSKPLETRKAASSTSSKISSESAKHVENSTGIGILLPSKLQSKKSSVIANKSGGREIELNVPTPKMAKSISSNIKDKLETSLHSEPDQSKNSCARSMTLPPKSASGFDKQSQLINENTSPSTSKVLNDRISMDMLVQSRSPLASANIRERKKAMAKMNAISLIKRKGGLSKTNPNQVRPDPEKRKSMKRQFEDEDEEADDVTEKSALSQRFIELMNAQSKHENLAYIAELVEQQDYFNKMEKKEQMEEKMLSTFKVPCKAVMCLKCKYKWFSASDLCRAEGHPIKVIDTVKRYFKCDNCSNRTVSLEIIPLLSCKNCGSAKWSRAPMIREKIVKSDASLCIRGDEQKFLDSLGGSVNLNLLVP